MTETATLTLTDFLLARIAEDEAMAAQLNAQYDGWKYRSRLDVTTISFGGQVSWTLRPPRLLAECEAKRRIVEREHVACAGHPGAFMPHDDYGAGYCWRADEENPTLLDLAQPYADHPDYREEWRVDNVDDAGQDG